MIKSPSEIVKGMIDNDVFSQWMGIHVDAVDAGTCTLSCTIQPEMLNGFNVLHGGISYALADSALAFAANSRGTKCMSIETSISHIRPVQMGDKLTAVATEKHRGKTIGVYEVVITNELDKVVALFKGTVHSTGEKW